MKKALSLVLSFVLVIGVIWNVSLSVNAAGIDDLTFTLSSDGTYYHISGCNTFAEGDLVIPEEYKDLPVKCIDDSAFNGCVGLTSLTIPDSVTSIGKRAVYGCTGLISVIMGNGVKNIGEDAFDNSYYLSNLYITDIAAWCALEFENWQSNPLYYADNLYLNNELVKDLVIPEGVTDIPQAAFRNCKSIRSVVIPGTVKSIGVVAFENCDSLLFATIGDGVTSIGYRAFAICNVLNTIVIPDSVTTIEDYAFYACRTLKSVSMGKGLKSVGNRVFDECGSIEGVYITDNETYSDIEFGDHGWPNPVPLAVYVCSDEKNVGNLVIPEGIATIPIWAYYNWDHITSVEIHNGLKSIQKGAFENCNGIESIVIPDSVTTIDESAFLDCNNLKDVYYTGTEEEWKAISIAVNNGPLLNARIHYNYCEHDFSTPVYIAPPCTQKGYTIYECHCGASRLADFIDVTGHIDSDSDGLCDQCNKNLGVSVTDPPESNITGVLSIFNIMVEWLKQLLNSFDFLGV